MYCIVRTINGKRTAYFNGYRYRSNGFQPHWHTEIVRIYHSVQEAQNVLSQFTDKEGIEIQELIIQKLTHPTD